MNEVVPDGAFEAVARANLDWAVSQQQLNGFFDNCAFVAGRAPFTHTIAYAARGLLESGLLLNDAGYMESASRCASTAMAHLAADGFLPGQIRVDGRAAARYCCLTGNCQFAILWAKLFHQTDAGHFQRAAIQALDYVIAQQDIDNPNLDVRGAIKGSHPIWGRYSPMTFPNWPAKFFVDAMLLRSSWQ
jgi:hypothetical protein